VLVDLAAHKARIDLLALLILDTPLRKVARTGGGEWAGPCPFCGGRDRFRVQPRLGYWWCRRCSGERWQDAIDYVRQRDGLSFFEACQRLGVLQTAPSQHGIRTRRAAVVASDLGLRRAADLQRAGREPPAASWQHAGRRFLEACQAALWSPAGRLARSYLHARGLTDSALRRWRLGLQPDHGASEPAAAWGLNGDEIVLPRGIVIPWFGGGNLWQLKVRTASRVARYRYLAVRGGRASLFGVDGLRAEHPVALTEGEFDALLVDQLVGDIVTAVTLGGCRARPDQLTIEAFNRCSVLLGLYDADRDGQAGLERLRGALERLTPVTVPHGKDVTEFHQRGGDVRGLIQAALLSSATRGKPGSPPSGKFKIEPLESESEVD
jgi:hypothetical protein